MDAWANLHLLGQSVTFLARSPRSARRRRAAPDGDGGAKGNTLLYCCTPTPHVWCVSNVTYEQVLEEDARSTARGAKLSKDRELQGKSLLSLLVLQHRLESFAGVHYYHDTTYRVKA